MTRNFKLNKFITYFFNEINKYEREYLCRRCLDNMKLVSGYKNIIRCTRRGCRAQEMFLKKGPFNNSKLSFENIIKVIYHLVIGDKMKSISLLYGIDKKSVKRILIKMGELIYDYN
ncbi:hypothetical protein DMUE_3461, partial [Dictyocoela muelleri]